MIKAGTVFTTGNATVAELPVGTVLTVVGPGEVEVTEIENSTSFELGDAIFVTNKNRYGFIVRGTNVNGRLDGVLADGEHFYVGRDGDDRFVVRIAHEDNIEQVG